MSEPILTKFYVDVMNEKVNAICHDCMTSSNKSVDKYVEEFDETDDNCIGYDGRLWFHKYILRKLLNYLASHNILSTANIQLLPPILPGYGQDLVINIEVRIKPDTPEPDFAKEIIYIHRLRLNSNTKSI